MSDKTANILWAVGIAIVVAGYFAWHKTDWLDAVKPADTKAQKRAEQKKRFKEWAYIAKTKMLSDSEELSLVVIPSATSRILDTKSFIYKKREFKQASITCPEARQDEIDN